MQHFSKSSSTGKFYSDKFCVTFFNRISRFQNFAFEEKILIEKIFEKLNSLNLERQELETNPLLRPDSTEARHNLGMKTNTDAEVFAEIRRRKDNF